MRIDEADIGFWSCAIILMIGACYALFADRQKSMFEIDPKYEVPASNCVRYCIEHRVNFKDRPSFSEAVIYCDKQYGKKRCCRGKHDPQYFSLCEEAGEYRP